MFPHRVWCVLGLALFSVFWGAVMERTFGASSSVRYLLSINVVLASLSIIIIIMIIVNDANWTASRGLALCRPPWARCGVVRVRAALCVGAPALNHK